jgi:hypothetical protein
LHCGFDLLNQQLKSSTSRYFPPISFCAPHVSLSFFSFTRNHHVLNSILFLYRSGKAKISSASVSAAPAAGAAAPAAAKKEEAKKEEPKEEEEADLGFSLFD